MRRLAIALGIFALTVAVLAVVAGEKLSAPARRVIGPPPTDFNAQSVVIKDASGNAILGWYVPGQKSAGAVLLLHGVRSDRRQMLGRAKDFQKLGYSVLLIDLPAHGESAGTSITFGFREAEGVRASLHFLRESLPGEKVAIVGVSLGAASFVLADISPPPDAVVLESMYPTIEEAVTNRLRIKAGELGAALSPLLLSQLPWRLGIHPEQLRPIDHIAAIQAPILLAAGTEDRHTTIAETERLFRAASPPKELWLVSGAGHVDLYGFDPRAYDAKVTPFLAEHLRGKGK